MESEASEMAGMPAMQHGDFCWTEIASSDADKCQAFYETIFGWQFNSGGSADPGMDYREYTTGGDAPVGGLYEIKPEWFGGNPPPPHFMTYVAVDNVDENAELARELGGTVHKVMDIPNVGRMAIIEDPTGAKIATFKP
jgi:predicted enzyme related to lactoylglutathione lyase